MASCTVCGMVLQPGVAFCTACGAPTRASAVYCAACGAKLDGSAAFCGACGARVAGNAFTMPKPEAARATSPAGPTSFAVGSGAAPAGARLSERTGLRSGDWLVIIGALAFILMDFVNWGAIKSVYAGSTAWTWYHSVSAWWWGGYWLTALNRSYFSWSTGFQSAYFWSGWAPMLINLVLHVASILCVVAGVQALRRGLGGADVNARLVRAWGIVAAAAKGASILLSILFWAALQPRYHLISISITSFVSLAGAIAIIVGAGLMPAGTSRRTAGGTFGQAAWR